MLKHNTNGNIEVKEYFIVALEKLNKIVKVVSVANDVLDKINKIFDDYNMTCERASEVRPLIWKYDRFSLITEKQYKDIITQLEFENAPPEDPTGISYSDEQIKEKAKKICMIVKMPHLIANIVSSDVDLNSQYHYLYQKYSYIYENIFPTIFIEGNLLKKEHMKELNKIYKLMRVPLL